MTNTPALRMLTTDGYSVVVEAFACHPVTRQLVLLSLVGEPDAMKAIRATLSVGLTFTITGCPRCEWPKHPDTFFTMIQRRLPSGAHSVLWLPQHGTSVGIQHDTRAYIIAREAPTEGPPPTFIDVLDRVLACPIRPEWQTALWEQARQSGWVKPLDSYNCTVWEFHPQINEIVAWIQTQLTAQHLTLPALPSPIAEEVHA
ncbi:MAG: hypothetical protein AAB433_03050 [Nitrospirota bacterium]